MQKTSWLIFFSVILWGSINAQVFSGGINMGIAGGQIDGDKMAGFHHFGIITGGFTDVNLSHVFYIELGLRYTGKGAAQALKTVPKGYSRTLTNLHYIDIPVLFTYRYGENYDFQAGILSGYLFKTQLQDFNGVIVDENLYHYNKWDFEAVAGMYYKWYKNFKMGLHYAYSLRFISNSPNQSNNVLLLSGKYYLGKHSN